MSFVEWIICFICLVCYSFLLFTVLNGICLSLCDMVLTSLLSRHKKHLMLQRRVNGRTSRKMLKKKTLRIMLTRGLLPARRKGFLVKWLSNIAQLQWRKRNHCILLGVFLYTWLTWHFNICLPIFYNCCSCRWYGWWETSSFFVADANSSKEPFAIVSAELVCFFCVFCSLMVRNTSIYYYYFYNSKILFQ